MAFYKALENVELKKYSEASPSNFKVIFYSKGLFKSTKLFDKEIKAKFPTILMMTVSHL